MPELSTWSNFYMLAGTAAGALIGLQFVVMTLIAGMPRRGAPDAAAAFATPVIVHFSSVLLLSCVVVAPWPSLTAAGCACVLIGAGGFIYGIFICDRMRRQAAYRPELQDWISYAVLPLAGYSLLAAASAMLLRKHSDALFGIAAASLLLLFSGIHNAWDSVTYHVFVVRQPEPAAITPSPPSAG